MLIVILLVIQMTNKNAIQIIMLIIMLIIKVIPTNSVNSNTFNNRL